MPPSNPSVLERMLDPGEQLLWSGHPRRGILFRVQDLYLIPFTLVWLGGVVAWEIGVLTSMKNAPVAMRVIFPTVGLLFVGIGLHFVVGRFLVDARARERTTYGVTNERILILTGLFSRQTRSLPLRTLSEISLTERADHSGTIAFGPQHPLTTFFPAGAWPGMGRYVPPSFERIEDVRRVHDIIRNAQRPVQGRS